MANAPRISTLSPTLPLSLLLIAVPCVLPARAEDAPDLAGTWSWSWNDPAGRTHHHLLEVEGIGNKLAARERFDDLEPVPVLNLRLDGKKKTIQFTVVRGERRADYKGVVADRDTIRGTVIVTSQGQSSEDPWEAKRKDKDVKKK